MSAAEIEDNSDGRVVLFKFCTFSTNVLLSKFVSFGIHFQTTSGLKAYLEFLNDEAFVRKNADVNLVLWDGTNEKNFVEYLVLNLGSLSRYSQDFKQTWLDLSAVSILAKTAKTIDSTKFSCYTALTNVADDALIEKFEEIQTYANMNVERLKLFYQSLIRNELRRDKRQICENNKKYDVQMLALTLSNNVGTSIFVTMNGLQ
jgi:hypothetical protein